MFINFKTEIMNLMSKWSLLLLSFVIFSSSCKEDSNDRSEQPATIKMNMTDAPAEFDVVNIDIQSVEIHIEDNEDSGWKVLDVEPGIYNLLNYTNGVDTLIAAGDVPPGKISQVRLILGPDNSVVVEGEVEDLTVPSGQQSGLKLNFNKELEPGLVYEFWLDFDAQRSIVKTGNGKYILKPVIRVFSKNTTGSIEGYVDPEVSEPTILAYNAAGDSASARADRESGYFLLSGLNAGTYTMEFDPIDPYLDKTVNGTSVTVGNVTYVDTVYISQ